MEIVADEDGRTDWTDRINLCYLNKSHKISLTNMQVHERNDLRNFISNYGLTDGTNFYKKILVQYVYK